MRLLGSSQGSLQTFYLLGCGEVEMLLWAERCCLLPSWHQFLQIEFCWIPFSGMKGAQDCSNTRVGAACQVLLTSQPSWRLESDKLVTGEDNWLLKATLAPPNNRRTFALIPVDNGSSFNWWEGRMCVPIFVFLAKIGIHGCCSVCSCTSIIPRCNCLCLLPPS